MVVVSPSTRQDKSRKCPVSLKEHAFYWNNKESGKEWYKQLYIIRTINAPK